MKRIWTFKVLKVVRQHILGVVGNVMYCFVGNLTDPAVEEFWKPVKIWQNYGCNRVAHLFETQMRSLRRKCTKHVFVAEALPHSPLVEHTALPHIP